MTETNQQATAETTAAPSARAGDKLIELVTPLIAPLGYEIVHLECQLQRQKILRIFIDRLANSDPAQDRIGVTIEDCVKVARTLDEPLDAIPEVDSIFKGTYELEVSSPGIDRPLRQPKDYQRFSGQEARIHVYRPLTEEEIGNAKYREKNPKQKNFLGTLKGLRGDRVVLDVGTGKTKGLDVEIPLSLISKANLEPKIDANAQIKERERQS